jgi:hypothetical protein
MPVVTHIVSFLVGSWFGIAVVALLMAAARDE